MTISPEIKKRLIGLASSYEEPYPILVQGEGSYFKNLKKICGYYDEEEGYDDDAHQAALYLEDENKHDPGNAVRVEIDDLTVGYLSKQQAALYRTKIKDLNAPENPIAICGASIKGGFLKRNGDVADFGVRLDFDLNDFSLVPVRLREEESQSPPALDALKKRLEEKPEPVSARPPSKTIPPQVKVSKIPFIAILLVACVALIAVCLIVDQISLLAENAGYLSTRTPAPTQTSYLSPLDKLYLTSTAQALNQPSQTPEPTRDAYRPQSVDDYMNQYGGNPEVYAEILSLSDCAALQEKFDIADQNLSLQEPGTAQYEWGIGYMTASDDRMRLIGCY